MSYETDIFAPSDESSLQLYVAIDKVGKWE